MTALARNSPILHPGVEGALRHRLGQVGAHMGAIDAGDFLDGHFRRHLFALAGAAAGDFDHTVFQTTRANGDAPRQTDQIHGGEFRARAVLAIIQQRL